jgi:hypothetical protein
MIYNWAIETFNVKNTFIMYSFFHRRYRSDKKTMLHCDRNLLSDSENFEYFENHKIENCYFTFLPYWCWSETEQNYICQTYKTNYYSIDARDLNLSYLNQNRHKVDKKIYNTLKKFEWPAYEHFVNSLELSNSVFAEIFLECVDALFNDRPLIFQNRDGFHLNQLGNGIVCDYFLKQVKEHINVQLNIEM